MKKFSILFFLILITNLHAFISYEHERIGDAANLHGINGDTFIMDNGLKLTFGQLVTMGDYFGKKNESIVLDLKSEKMIKDPLVAEQHFMDVYNSLSKGSKEEGLLLLKMIDNEKTVIDKAIKSGESEYDAYSKLCSIEDIEFTLITEGYYITLSSTNFDHFVDPDLKVAENAFLAGYRLALKTVKDTLDVEKLKKAYAIYGFACHFLTDIFSAGHMRAPRFELWQQVNGIGSAQISGLLALCQHQEDGIHGLNVRNKFAAWTAYGDACLFENKKEENMAVLAMQKGIDEIYDVFIKKSSLEKSLHALDDYIPTTTDNNFSPLFKIDEKTGKVLRRKDVADRFCKEYTSYWFGLTTLMKLYYYHVGEENSYLSEEHLEKMKSCLSKNWAPIEGNKKINHSTDLPDAKQIASLPEMPDEELKKVFSEKPVALSDEHFNTLLQINDHLQSQKNNN